MENEPPDNNDDAFFLFWLLRDKKDADSRIDELAGCGTLLLIAAVCLAALFL